MRFSTKPQKFSPRNRLQIGPSLGNFCAFSVNRTH